MIIEAATPIGSSEAKEKKDPVQEETDFGALAVAHETSNIAIAV